MFIPGMFICVCGDDAGIGEDTGWSIPGILIGGAGDGVAFGVGEGIVIGCCAGTESVTARKTNMGDKKYLIVGLILFMILLCILGRQAGNLRHTRF